MFFKLMFMFVLKSLIIYFIEVLEMFVVLYKSLLVLFLCFIMFVILFCFENSIIVVDIKGDI